MQKGKCAYYATCRKSIRNGFHIDHILALSKGGSNWIRNIQLTCASCNLSKQAKHPLVFARQIGLLL